MFLLKVQPARAEAMRLTAELSAKSAQEIPQLPDMNAMVEIQDRAVAA